MLVSPLFSPFVEHGVNSRYGCYQPGLGLPLVKLLLEKTQLNVIALTSKSKPSSSASSSSSSLSASSEILSHPRVKLINSVDLLDEQTVQRAADEVKDILGGKKDVRLVVCLAGQVGDRSISRSL
jgi:hypothetical protein